MYGLVLVPLDGSRFGEHALPVALSLSRRTGAALHLLNVAEPLPAFAPGGWPEEFQKHARDYLEMVGERIREHAGGPVSLHVLPGHAAEVIQQEAAVHAADLVVMASHGRGSLSRAWLGSVTDALVRHADRPVLVVRPEGSAGEAESEEWTLSKLLVPLDGSEVSEAVLDHAAEMAALFGARVRLLRVVPFPVEFISPHPPHMIQANREFVDQTSKEAATYLDHHAARLRERGLAVETKVQVVTQAAHGILADAEESGSDFIAMGTHGRGSLARTFLGSTSDKVLRGTRHPLLLFRSPH